MNSHMTRRRGFPGHVTVHLVNSQTSQGSGEDG